MGCDKVRIGEERQARPGMALRGGARLGLAGADRHGPVRQGPVSRGMERQPWRDTARPGKASRGVAGVAWVAWRGPAWIGKRRADLAICSIK